MDIRTLLGVSSVWPANTEVVVGVVTFDNTGGIGFNTPVLIDNKSNHSGHITCLPYFNSSEYSIGRNVIDITGNVAIIDQKKFLDRSPIKIEHFDYGEMNDIVSKVKTEAAVTFIIEDRKGMTEFITDIDNLAKNFSESSVTNQQFSDSDISEFVMQISFYDIDYAVPIFRHDSSGIAVNFGLLRHDNSRITVLEEVFLLLSNDKHIHTIEGQAMRPSGFTLVPITKAMMKRITCKSRNVKKSQPSLKFDSTMTSTVGNWRYVRTSTSGIDY